MGSLGLWLRVGEWVELRHSLLQNRELVHHAVSRPCLGISRGFPRVHRGTSNSHDWASWGKGKGKFWEEGSGEVGPWG